MTTTTREAELLAEIIEHPDEDATRLVYADLLQQKDDPRGELIAVQCALAGLGILPRPSSSEWCTNAFLISPEICESEEMRRLRLREAALLKAHLKEWTKRVVEAATCTATQCRLSRGFLDHVAWRIRVNNAAPLEAVFEAAPLATSLALIGTDIAGGIESVRAFFKSKCLKSLRAFSFGSTLVNFGEGIRLLLESPHLKGVRKLEGELRGSVTQEMRLLSRGSFFDTLESLDLSSTVLTQSLPPTLPRLSELHLRNCKLGPQGAETLARCAELSGLTVLGLRDNAILSDGFGALLKSKHLGPQLRALNLRKNGLTTGNVQKLLTSPSDVLPELRVVDLSKIPRGAWDATILQKCDGLPSLIELHLEDTLFDDDAVEALAKSPLLSRLRVLDLRANTITERGARALAASEHCKNLRVLILTHNPLFSGGKKALADSPHLANARVVASPL